MADAFKSGNWKEGAYTPTGQSSTQAMATEVDCYSGFDDNVIEYRFSRATGKFDITVAQDDKSSSSDAILEWTLIVDGRQVDSKTIGFKDTAELSTNLSGVAVVKIAVKQKRDGGGCNGGSATALVTKAVVSG